MVAIGGSQLVHVVHGASSDEFDVAGSTVGSIRSLLLDALNLGGCKVAFVNDVRVPASYRLNGGDTLEFSVGWGRKGNDGVDLFSTDQLEKWKDAIAQWWGLEKMRLDHKKMVIALKMFFNISKKEAIELEFSSREYPEKLIEKMLDQVIEAFCDKLQNEPIAHIEEVSLSCQEGAQAYTVFKGQSYFHDVPGHIGLVGTIHYKDGSKQKIFQRFISHPFWQYSHRISSSN